jgi:hypothetical protein
VRFLRAGVVAVACSGNETEIDTVEDPVWTGTFESSTCKITPVDPVKPIAGGFSKPGLKLNLTLELCEGSPTFTPKTEFEWTVESPDPNAASETSGSGSFTGMSGEFELTLPKSVGASQVALKCVTSDPDGNALNDLQFITIPVYVGYDKNAPSAVYDGRVKELWLQTAAAMAKGETLLPGMAAAVTDSIYKHGGWLYRDSHVASGWQEMLAGTASQGNCFVMRDMWMGLMSTLGVGVSWERVDPGPGFWRFATIPASRQSFDPGQAGNTQPEGGAIDGWHFVSHAYGVLNGAAYDPTFNNIAFASFTPFVRWSVRDTLVFTPQGRRYRITTDATKGISKVVRQAPWNHYEYIDLDGSVPPPPAVTTRHRLGEVIVAQFVDPIAWSRVDANGDGSFDRLRAEGSILVTTPVGEQGTVAYSGTVFAGSSPVASAPSLTSMQDSYGLLENVSSGTHIFSLEFSGEALRSGALDGPYLGRFELSSVSGDSLDATTATTPAYTASSFGERVVRIASTTENRIDLDSDGLYDELVVGMTVNASTAGPAALDVVALDATGQSRVVGRSGSFAVVAGSNALSLALDGRQIRASGIDGPYLLKLSAGRFGSEPDTRLAQTLAYGHNEFEEPAVALVGSHVDYGEDTNDDGVFERLVMEVQVAVTRAGTYQIRARLARGGTTLTSVSKSETLPVSASYFFNLEFDGAQIGSHGLAGPYTLAELEIFDAAGAHVLSESDFYETQAYTSAQFGAPLIVEDGTATVSGLDTNANSLLDSLQVFVPILASQAGSIIAAADLVAPDGRIIEHYVAMDTLPTAGPHTIAIKFSGRRIYSLGQDGPYVVSNLLVYHASTTSNGLELEPITTAGYLASAFEPARGVLGTVSDLGSGTVLGATLVVDGTPEVSYTDATGDYWLYVPDAVDDSVTVTLADTPPLGPGQWGVLVDGQYVAQGTSARIYVTPDERETMNFVHGEAVGVPFAPSVRFAVRRMGRHPIRIGDPIRLRLTAAAPTTIAISIVSVAGRRIAEWPRRILSAGDSEVLLEAAHAKLPPGLYFIRVAWEGAGGVGSQEVLKLVVVDG